MLTAGFLSFTAMACLSLAMPRHWRQLKLPVIPVLAARAMQITGWLLLMVAFWLFSDANTYQAGWVIGVSIVLLNGIIWSLIFSLRPWLATILAGLAAPASLILLL